MRGLRGKRVNTVKDGMLIATVDIGAAINTGYCTTVDGRAGQRGQPLTEDRSFFSSKAISFFIERVRGVSP
jgi:hypothetical protein